MNKLFFIKVEMAEKWHWYFLNCSQIYSVPWISHLPLWSAGMRCVLSEHKGNGPPLLSQHSKERRSIIHLEHWGSPVTIHLYTNQCCHSPWLCFWNIACYLAISPSPFPYNTPYVCMCASKLWRCNSNIPFNTAHTLLYESAYWEIMVSNGLWRYQ